MSQRHLPRHHKAGALPHCGGFRYEQWSILFVDMEPAQQAAVIIMSLEGPACDIARNLSWNEINRRVVVNGQQQDPVTSLASLPFT